MRNNEIDYREPDPDEKKEDELQKHETTIECLAYYFDDTLFYSKSESKRQFIWEWIKSVDVVSIEDWNEVEEFAAKEHERLKDEKRKLPTSF